MSVSDFFQAFTRTSALNRKTRHELFKVFTTLGFTMGSCLAGCYSASHLPTFEENSILFSLLIIGLTFGIHLIQPTENNLAKRATMLWVLGWLVGCTLEPFVSSIISFGDGWSILMMAGILTMAMFIGFALAVLSFESPKVIYAVGSATAALSMLSWVYVLGLFYPTNGLINLLLVAWLVSTCVCFISNMNKMLDKAQRGENLDPVVNALLFFNSLVSIFIQTAVLLSRDKQQSRCRNDSNNNKKYKNRASVDSSGININLGTWSFSN